MHPNLSPSRNRIPISSTTPTSTEHSRASARVIHILTLSSLLSSFPLVALLLFVYPVVYLNPLPFCDTYADTTPRIIYQYQLHRLRITFLPVHAVYIPAVSYLLVLALYTSSTYLALAHQSLCYILVYLYVNVPTIIYAEHTLDMVFSSRSPCPRLRDDGMREFRLGANVVFDFAFTEAILFMGMVFAPLHDVEVVGRKINK